MGCVGLIRAAVAEPHSVHSNPNLMTLNNDNDLNYVTTSHQVHFVPKLSYRRHTQRTDSASRATKVVNKVRCWFVIQAGGTDHSCLAIGSWTRRQSLCAVS